MTKGKRAPGPWKDGEGLSRGRFVFDAQGYVVCQALPENVPLIAAAPTLLELWQRYLAGDKQVAHEAALLVDRLSAE